MVGHQVDWVAELECENRRLTTDPRLAPEPFPWPVPPRLNLHALAPWLLAVLAIIAVVVLLGWR
jgi:hypothetical protein